MKSIDIHTKSELLAALEGLALDEPIKLLLVRKTGRGIWTFPNDRTAFIETKYKRDGESYEAHQRRKRRIKKTGLTSAEIAFEKHKAKLISAVKRLPVSAFK